MTPDAQATASPCDRAEMFLRNMRMLWRTDPPLAVRVDAVDDDKRYALRTARSGDFTFTRRTGDGRELHLHSRNDPREEARRFVDRARFEDRYAFVVSGMGLGYHIEELGRRLRGDALIICIEPDLRTIATALSCVDFTDLFRTGRLLLLTDGEKGRLHDRLSPVSTVMMLGMEFLKHGPSCQIDGTAMTGVIQAITEFVTFTRMSLLTLVSNSRITCKNIAMNMGTYLATPPINVLRNRFKGDPAIIVSAGPSLQRNIHQLADLKGKAILCAVQTTVRPLMRHGIVPDFITSLDFHEMSRKFFQDVGDLSGAHLVAEPKATWHVIDEYPGPVSLLDNAWARLLVGDELGGRDGLKAGATVAHLAFYLARYMGCDPVIFVGQDLAFTGHLFYTPGVEIHHAWQSELNRFCTLEQKEWERIARNRPILRRVPGVDGHDVYTDELLLTYLEQFEKDIADTAVTVINATEGGAMIRGTQVMTLAEAAGRYCVRPIDTSRLAYRDTAVWHDASKLPAGLNELDKRIAELRAAIDVCEQLLGLFGELMDLLDDPFAFNRRLVKVDELRSRISNESRAYRIISAAGQLAELRRFSADRRISAEEHDEKERARRQLLRDKDFIGAARDDGHDVLSLLEAARQRMEEAISKA